MKGQNIFDRVKAVRAMDFLARSLNNVDHLERWLMYGVADGDQTLTDKEIADTYCDDATFTALSDEFTYLMRIARNNGGLFIDGLCVGERE